MASSRMFDGNTVIITGSASGISLQTATQFAEEGANAVIADIDSQAGSNAVKKLNSETEGQAKLPGDE